MLVHLLFASFLTICGIQTCLCLLRTSGESIASQLDVASLSSNSSNAKFFFKPHTPDGPGEKITAC